MTAVSLRASAAVRAAPLGTGSAAPSADAAALPDPGPLTSDATANAILLLAKMTLERRGAAIADHEEALVAVDQERTKQIARERDAANARTAAQHAGGFWHDVERVASGVGKWAGVVGSVALAASTCGAGTGVAALAIAGCVMSSAAFAQSEAHVFGDGALANDIGVGLEIGGALASGGAGLLATGAASASAVTRGARLASLATTSLSAGGHVVGGLAHIPASSFDARAEEAAADEKQSQIEGERLDRDIERIIQKLQDAYAAAARAVGVVRGALDAHDQTLLAAGTRV